MNDTPFDPIRRIASLEASAKLSNIIARLFNFRDMFRPDDLIVLLDVIDAAIDTNMRDIQRTRKLTSWKVNTRRTNNG